MRFVKIVFFLLSVIVLQTVAAARLNFFGVFPDLILVSVIILAVLEEEIPAVVLATLFGLAQDLLACGIYINTILKTLLCLIINIIKERFSGDENTLIFSLVAIVSPVLIIINGAMQLAGGARLDLFYFIFTLLVGTLYNLLLIPLLLPLIREVQK
ncbi:MAG: rod shape-determining protein MreD [Candidatus Margulisiibacteriota bacterium]